MKILVTAFNAFGGESINAAKEATFALPSVIGGAQIIVAEVPTEFGQACCIAAELITQHEPDAVVCVGQAAGTSAVAAERVAINIDDARIPDNAGAQPVDTPVATGGPAAYFATLPVKAMVLASREAGVPAELSHSAGTFVCNHLMYSVLHFLAESGRQQVRAGFVHVPCLPEQAVTKPGMPSLSKQDITAALAAMLGAVAEHTHDVHTQMGALN